MGVENKGALAVGKENPVIVATNEFKTSFIKSKCWLAKQSLLLKCGIRDVAAGAWLCSFGESYFKDFYKEICCILKKPPPSSTQFLLRCGEYEPLVRSVIEEGGVDKKLYNYAVMVGVNKGISCMLKNIKGKEDVGTSMVAAFGSGVAFSLVTGMRGPSVISVGVIFALCNGGFFKARKLFKPGQANDVSHDKTKGGSSLSDRLDHYSMNFNKELLTSNSRPPFASEQ